MNVARMLQLLCGCILLTGCLSVGTPSDDVVVEASERATIENPAEDKSGAFFLRRSMLCRKVFSSAMTNIAAQAGRDEDTLRGATICGIDEIFTNGVYTIKLAVAWSPAREDAASRILSATNVVEMAGYVPSVDEGQNLATWIGPRQVQTEDGKIHFLGISSMAIGRNTALSQENIRMAELDARAMAVRAFMVKERKMTDVRARFREVFKLRSHHPLCPDREMFACGYEVVSLELGEK